jgi:predicted DsbA family dithiol-disulfide isomerase
MNYQIEIYKLLIDNNHLLKQQNIILEKIQKELFLQNKNIKEKAI